jgi:nucleoid DNA-binding protein
MIKSELIQRVADKNLHLYRSDVEKVVNAVLEEILTALVRRDRVRATGLRRVPCRSRGRALALSMRVRLSSTKKPRIGARHQPRISGFSAELVSARARQSLWLLCVS